MLTCDQKIESEDTTMICKFQIIRLSLSSLNRVSIKQKNKIGRKKEILTFLVTRVVVPTGPFTNWLPSGFNGAAIPSTVCRMTANMTKIIETRMMLDVRLFFFVIVDDDDAIFVFCFYFSFLNFLILTCSICVVANVPAIAGCRVC